MNEILLEPMLDEDPPCPVVEEESGEVASFGVHHGRPKLLCVCLSPIHAEDLAQGYHTPCGRTVKVVLSR